jgi:hypothetical protein
VDLGATATKTFHFSTCKHAQVDTSKRVLRGRERLDDRQSTQCENATSVVYYMAVSAVRPYNSELQEDIGIMN